MMMAVTYAHAVVLRPAATPVGDHILVLTFTKVSEVPQSQHTISEKCAIGECLMLFRTRQDICICPS